MRLRVLDHPVADPGRRLRRIVTPADPLRNTHVYPVVVHWSSIRSSRADILRLGALARFAAVSPHTAVHIPAPPDAADRVDCFGRTPLALVLVRDDAGLRVSDWPRLRARTHHGPRPGVRRTVLAPAPRPRAAWTAAGQRFADAHPDRRLEHAGTLFVVAHRSRLFQLGDELTACGEEVATDRDVHRYGESLLTDVLDGLGLIAVEPIFHRRRWHPSEVPEPAAP